jgi:hypothetical protein
MLIYKTILAVVATSGFTGGLTGLYGVLMTPSVAIHMGVPVYLYAGLCGLLMALISLVAVVKLSHL